MATILKLSEESSKITTLLQSYFQSGNINFLVGSGASSPAIPLAGSIEQQVDKLLAEGKEQAANNLTLEFIENLVLKQGIFPGTTASNDASEALGQYVEFLAATDKILFERKNVLLPRQANIFCTNYDIFFEQASSRIPTLILNDGFRRIVPVGEDFPFAPECYFDRTYRSGAVYSQASEIPTINLMKLHGSLTWQRKADEIVHRSAPLSRLPDAEKGNPVKVTEKLADYFLIFPNLKKYNVTLVERVYYDMLRLYANALERENALLVCFGFSFQDQHILDVTRRSLRNPTAQIVIAAYDANAVAGFGEKFSEQSNVLIIGPPDTETLTFSEFNKLIKRALPVQ